MSDPVLVADVGGTHARFALATEGVLHEARRYPAAAFATGVDAVAGYLAEVGDKVSGASVAVAGPVVEGVGRLTNLPLEFSATELARRLSLPRVLVINDFAAVSSAVPYVEATKLSALGTAVPRDGMKAVIGPGTGLGMGALLPLGAAWLVLPSEGGHGDYAAGDPLEAELAAALRVRLPAGVTVTWEAVLSGPGIVNLYRAMCDVWGCEPRFENPREISAAGTDADDPVCHRTLESFCEALGAAAGNLALAVCAEGGVYLAGGIVPQLIEFIRTSPFRRRFEDRGAMSDYTKRIATLAILDADIGLAGAARAFAGRWDGGVLQLPRGSTVTGR